MNQLKVGLSAVGGGLAIFGLTLVGENFWLGIIATLIGAVIIVGAVVLNKKGYPVGK